jgi:Tfp pilus assembly pilus retraction ATPase PilT
MISPEALRKISNLQEVDFAYDFRARFVFVETFISNLEHWLVALRAIEKGSTLNDLHLPTCFGTVYHCPTGILSW